MRQFSARMFPDRVTFKTASTQTGLRGGPFPAYTGTTVTPAYVETVIDADQRIETGGAGADARPISKTVYRVFTDADPNVGLSREIMVDDHILWNNGNLTLQVLETPQWQNPLWLTQCVQVGVIPS